MQKFLNYKRVCEGKSDNTVRSYKYYLQSFFSFLGKDDIKLVTSQDIEDYICEMDKKGLSKKTISLHLIAIKVMMKYYKIVDVDVPVIKYGKRVLDLPTKEEVAVFLNQKMSDEDRAMILLLLSTGMRLSELCGLNIEDIKEDKIKVIGKGDKERVIWLNETAKEAIKALTHSDGAIKCSRKAGKLIQIGKRQVERKISHLAEYGGLGGRLTVHTLRHLFASDMIENGADVMVLRDILGHSSVATTQIYVHLTGDRIKDQVNRFTSRW